MNSILRLTVLLGVALAAASGPFIAAAEAQTAITPLDPIIGTLPSKPSGAQDSYDKGSIEQMMKMVELSRIIGGGITQMYNTIVNETTTLEKIRDAQLGVRSVPLYNDPADVTARAGGVGLTEMAEGALNGAFVGPQGVSDALTSYRKRYGLDKAFALKDSDSFSKTLIAQASAQGVIAASTAEDSYKRANASTDRLDGYIRALQASADLKTSVDLNTRVMLELTQEINESIRTQAGIATVAGAHFMIIGGESGANDSFLTSLQTFNR